MTELLMKDMLAFDEQILRYLHEYYKILTAKEINIKTEAGKVEILTYITNNCYVNKYISNFLAKPYFDSSSHITIVQLFYDQYQIELYKDRESLRARNSLQSSFNIKMAKNISKELVIFRNCISHQNTLRDELVQRFYENEYFYLYFISQPLMKNMYTDYSKKSIKLCLKNIMSINLQKPQSFALYYPGYQQFMPKSSDNCNSERYGLNHLNNEEIEEMFQQSQPKKLFRFEVFNAREDYSRIIDRNYDVSHVSELKQEIEPTKVDPEKQFGNMTNDEFYSKNQFTNTLSMMTEKGREFNKTGKLSKVNKTNAPSVINVDDL